MDYDASSAQRAPERADTAERAADVLKDFAKKKLCVVIAVEQSYAW